jgi:hypothetical protein
MAKRNPIAREVREPKYRRRVVPLKTYTLPDPAKITALEWGAVWDELIRQAQEDEPEGRTS